MSRGFFTSVRVFALLLGLALTVQGFVLGYFVISSIISVLLIILLLDSLHKIFKLSFKNEKIRKVLQKHISIVKIITFVMLIILSAFYAKEQNIAMFTVEILGSALMGATMLLTNWADEIDEENRTKKTK